MTSIFKHLVQVNDLVQITDKATGCDYQNQEDKIDNAMWYH